MGLDMYLTKRTYIGAEYEHREVGGKIELTAKGVPISINLRRVHSITEKIGYWRKANQIHNWFVDNVQNGNDDCGEHSVSREQFQELLADVTAVLNARGTEYEIGEVEELLPPQSGFFFGETEITEWYWRDLEYTRELIEGILREMDIDEQSPNVWITYYYQSSW